MNNLQTYKTSQADVISELTLDTFKNFVAFLEVERQSVKTYAKVAKQIFKYFWENNIRKPIREDIITFRNYLRDRLKPNTVQLYITVTRLFFRWTAQKGIYPNIADHVKGAKTDRYPKKDAFTEEQAKDIFQHMSGNDLQTLRNKAMLSLMFTTALRTIEIQRANIDDIRTIGGHTVLFIQGKGRLEKNEYQKIAPHVEKLIRAYLKERKTTDGTAPLFASLSNNYREGRLSTVSISQIAKRAFIQAGFNSPRLTAHSTRHSAVTWALQHGKSIEEVQQFARHSNINTTMVYNHALDRAKNDCENVISEALF